MKPLDKIKVLWFVFTLYTRRKSDRVKYYARAALLHAVIAAPTFIFLHPPHDAPAIAVPLIWIFTYLLFIFFLSPHGPLMSPHSHSQRGGG